MNQKQQLIAELTPVLKKKGYKKRRQTWHKEKSDLTIVFNIQNSYYGDDEYYINLGIVINELRSDGKPILGADINQRVPSKNEKGAFVSSDTLVDILDLWEERYGDMTSLRKKAVEGELPILTEGRAISFLTTVRLG